MPNNVNFQIPFNPQQGQTEQVLAAIQLANQIKNQRTQTSLAQQQVAMQQQALPGEMAERDANTAKAKADAASIQQQTELRKELIGVLGGTTPGAQPVSAPGDQQQQSQPQPTSGLIGQTVNNILQDQSLSSEEKTAIRLAGNQAYLNLFVDPQNALKGVTDTYNDILKQHGDNTRAIKTDVREDANSSTGYSEVAVRPDGSKAYQHPVPPPKADSLEAATAALARANYNYTQNPTPGTKAAQALYQMQYTALYNQKLADFTREKALTHGNTMDAKAIEDLTKLYTDPQHGYQQFISQANATKDTIAAARSGSELAASLSPMMTALGITSYAGIHRINQTEVEQAGPQVGSIYRRINALLDRSATGTIPQDTAKEMNGLIDTLVRNRAQSTLSSANMIVANSRAAGGMLDPNTVMVMDKDGTAVPLATMTEKAQNLISAGQPQQAAPAAGKSAPQQSAPTATNPKTGERVILQNGKWVPLQ